MPLSVLSMYVIQFYIHKSSSLTNTNMPLFVLSQYVNSLNLYGNFFYSAFDEYYVTLMVS